MRINPFLFCGTVVLSILVAGCSNHENQDAQLKSGAEVSVEVDPVDEAGFKDLVANRNGKILLLNMWATWCIPCREEFPDLVKIANEYANENVEVVGISADFPDEVDSKIIPFLKSQNVSFKNYVKDFQDDGVFIDMVNPNWSGALPATFVYDQNGILRQSHIGENDFQGFRSMIEQVRQSEGG